MTVSHEHVPPHEGARDAGPAVLVIHDPIARSEVPDLCERVRTLLRATGAHWVACDVGALTEPDAVTVEALARMQLTARRLGHGIRLYGAGSRLRELLALMGLEDVLSLGPDVRLQPGGEAEEREEARGVQERVEPDDPAL